MKTRIQLLVAVMIFSFLMVSCEKESFVEEPAGIEAPDPDLPEIAVPEITDERALFKGLSDSLLQWMEAGEAAGAAGVRSLFAGDNQSVSLRSSRLAYFEVFLAGNTLSGEYPFQRSGCMMFSPTIRPVGGRQVSNDENLFDLGLFSGMPVAGQRGAINFMTNLPMCQYGNSDNSITPPSPRNTASPPPPPPSPSA